jgi:hypothetical protein
MPSSRSWWAAKARQLRTHLFANVSEDERRGVAAWATPAELALYDSMHRADRRHGLDVVASLRRAGITDREVLVAGLLHDCAKGDTGAGPRVAWSLGEAFGPWVLRLAARVPGWGATLDRLRDHAEASAALVAAAGGAPRTVDLIRHQAAPVDPVAGRALQRADEAS